ncbi:hypothetical protein [Paraflavitalea pollutisoli]|uniref:hypothetical protein n=1 Tax=Paraflavitalea pollutisoli TaxID=3034143 RepID=UPI0023ECB2E6|nr:hypothetical protein [Paraflavitalea sp. H1-2-19X]
MNHNQPALPTSSQQSAINKLAASTPHNGNNIDMMRGYYVEKIQELNTQLTRLNLMENAREISAICHEIIRAKKGLTKLSR